MRTSSMSYCVAEFRKTKNPLFLIRAFRLLVSQGRVQEVVWNLYCSVFYGPSPVRMTPRRKLQPVLENFKPLLSVSDFLSRGKLIDVFGGEYAVRQLPEDFSGVRIEAVSCSQEILIMGEYGLPGKRIAVVTKSSCKIIKFYMGDPSVLHIHSLYRPANSKNILITTGEKAKYLDLWDLQGSSIAFGKRLRQSLAGYTAIQKVGGEYYLGTDFSQRPNYIENLDGKKYFFPEKAWKMFAMRFQQYQDRFLVSLNVEFPVFGGRYTLSIFDCVREEFVYCEYQDYRGPKEDSQALIQAVIAQRSHADELGC